MNPPEKYAQIVNGHRYRIETATFLCSNAWWDGHNWERRGTNRFLYRTARGRLFFLDMSQWQGSEPIWITPVEEAQPDVDDYAGEDGAASFFEDCAAHGQAAVEFEVAFPGRTVEDA